MERDTHNEENGQAYAEETHEQIEFWHRELTS
jgi:hypothetical protein